MISLSELAKRPEPVFKLGNMRKAVPWSVYPRKAGALEVIVQSSGRIARVNLETGRAMLSNGKGGHQGFLQLQPFLGAVEVETPAAVMELLKGIPQ